MTSLIAWLVYLKAYRLKHPELTLQQAQKLAAVDYKHVMDPIIGAKTSKSITEHARYGRGNGIQPDISPGVYFHPHIHSTKSSDWYIDAHVRRLD